MAFNVSTNVWESDVNVNNNTSIAHVQVIITTSGSSYSNYDHYGSIVIDGTTYSHGAYTLPSNTTRTFESTKTITHSDDGSKTINWSYSFPVKTTDTRTGSGTLTLTTIARASQPSVSSASVNLGSQVTINTNRASSNFTHTLSYSIGSLTNQTSGLGASSNVGASTTFTPPVSLAEQFPNAKTGVVTITCKTYNGTALLGTKTCTLSVNTEDTTTYQPSMTLNATASNQFNSKYLNKVSGVTISATNTAKYNATISAYSISGLSKTSSNENLVISLINEELSSASQSFTISGSVTDSRGYTKDATTSITLYRYNAPQITQYSVLRCNSSGTISNSGTYAKVSVTYTYQNDGYSNSISVKKININNTDYNLTATETTSDGVVTGTGETIVGGGNLAVTSRYSYTITITDAVGKTATQTGVVPTSERIMSIRPQGKGIAFGKFAESDNLLESAWNITAPQFNGSLNGSASSATNATNVNVLSTNSLTSGTNYYPLFATTNSGNTRARGNANILLPHVNGSLDIQRSLAFILYASEQLTNATAWGQTNLSSVASSSIVGTGFAIDGVKIKINNSSIKTIKIQSNVTAFRPNKQSDVYFRVQCNRASGNYAPTMLYETVNLANNYITGNAYTIIVQVQQNDTIQMAFGTGVANTAVQHMGVGLLIEDITEY